MDTVCTGRRRLFVPKDFVVESEVADNGCGKYGGVAGATSARKLAGGGDLRLLPFIVTSGSGCSKGDGSGVSNEEM